MSDYTDEYLTDLLRELLRIADAADTVAGVLVKAGENLEGESDG